jgi:hypothetical protein
MFFAIGPFTFLPELGQMFVVQPVRQRDGGLIPPIVPSLLAADQEDRRAPGIEGVEEAVGPASVLHPELAHVGVPRGSDAGAIRETQRGSEALEQDDDGIDILLLFGRQAVPPRPKHIRVFDLPFYERNITDKEYRDKTFQGEGATCESIALASTTVPPALWYDRW